MNIIVLCGLPGSGKSTIAKKYFPNYHYINQDELGSKDACLKAYIEALQQNKDIIVDRTNINKRQRKDWINLAQYHGAEKITCIVLDVPEEECISRIHLRKGHKTIGPDISLDKKRKIVYTFLKDYEIPSLDEGFNSILFTRN